MVCCVLLMGYGTIGDILPLLTLASYLQHNILPPPSFLASSSSSTSSSSSSTSSSSFSYSSSSFFASSSSSTSSSSSSSSFSSSTSTLSSSSTSSSSTSSSSSSSLSSSSSSLQSFLKDEFVIIFVTNRCHREVIEREILVNHRTSTQKYKIGQDQELGRIVANRIEFHYVDIVDIAIDARHDYGDDACDIDDDDNDGSYDNTIYNDHHDLQQLAPFYLKLARDSSITFVIANLFALEGWLIASSLSVPCLFIHPHFKGDLSSDLVMKLLKKSAPGLYRYCFHSDNPINRNVGLHWMTYLWPLLSDKYDCVREALGLLSPCSLSIENIKPMPLGVLLSHSPRIASNLLNKTRDIDFDFNQILRPIGYIDKFSSGFGSSTDERVTIAAGTNIALQFIESLQSSNIQGVICFDFGSMTKLIEECEDGEQVAAAIVNLSLHFGIIFAVHSCMKLLQSLEEIFSAADSIVKSISTVSNIDDNLLPKHVRTCNGNVIIMPGFIDHGIIFRKCVTIVHHGGSGTVGACLRLGIPQVVVPFMHDQFMWADTLQAFNGSPNPLPLSTVFPRVSAAIGFQDKRIGCVSLPLIDELRARLLVSTSPQMRFRCGCLGKSMRDDPKEDGLSNIVHEVISHLKASLGHRQCISKVADSVPSIGGSDVVCHDSSGDEHCWHEFDLSDGNSILLATHHSAAPEETAFIFQEIFHDNVYQLPQAFSLREGDIVVDCGANVGMFCVHCELQFSTPNALAILSIEPMPQNIRLLRKNVDLYCPQAIICERALTRGQDSSNSSVCPILIGNESSLDETAISAGSNNRIDMVYFPRAPGNSCKYSALSAKLSHLHRYASKQVLEKGLIERTETVNCRTSTLTEILDQHWLKLVEVSMKSRTDYVSETRDVMHRPRISLLKIDVEGSEMDTLLGLSEHYWNLVDNIFIETSIEDEYGNSTPIVDMLEVHGFNVAVNDGHGYGTVIVFASRKELIFD